MTRTELQELFQGRTLAFVGDSNLRKLYHALASMLDSTYNFDTQFQMKVLWQFGIWHLAFGIWHLAFV